MMGKGKVTMTKELIGASCGTAMSAVGTAIQPSEVLQIISLVITIIGGLVTTIFAIWGWWKKASADGKISKEEVDELEDIVKKGINKDENKK